MHVFGNLWSSVASWLQMCGRDYWARFERFVKEVAYRAKEVFVITGPLFLPRRTPTGFEMCHPMIGAVPW